MGSFPTRHFQESKPQYGDPDKFSSKPRRKTKILAPSIKIQLLWVAECQHLQLLNQGAKMFTKICYGYTGSLRGDFHGQITKNYKEKEITIF